MQVSALTPCSLLPRKCYTIHFPSGFTFCLKIPMQITVYELTEIMRNYTALHSLYGLKIQGVKVQPKYLATLDNNVIVDLYMSQTNNMDKELIPIRNCQFRVIYAIKDVTANEQGICPSKRYQFLGKIASKNNMDSNLFTNPQQILARNRQTGQLVSLTKYQKSNLSFSVTEQLLCLLNLSKMWQKESHPIFNPIIDTFQTSESVYLIRKQLPFRLDRMIGYQKDLLDFVVYQLAKIVHLAAKGGKPVDQIRIDGFKMDFQFRVCFAIGVAVADTEDDKKDNQNEGQKLCGFGTKMVELLQHILKNCDVKIIELYIPLLHWLKNKRITNYLQFLKYVQIPSPLQDPKKKSILQSLLKSNNSPKLQPLSLQELSELQKTYKPLTDIFTMTSTQKNQGSTTNRSYHKQSVKQVIENVSTVKKRKQQSIVCTRPALQIRAQVKRNKSKANQKNKVKNNHSFVEKKNVSKEQRSLRKISQFLIQD